MYEYSDEMEQGSRPRVVEAVLIVLLVVLVVGVGVFYGLREDEPVAVVTATGDEVESGVLLPEAEVGADLSLAPMVDEEPVGDAGVVGSSDPVVVEGVTRENVLDVFLGSGLSAEDAGCVADVLMGDESLDSQSLGVLVADPANAGEADRELAVALERSLEVCEPVFPVVPLD